MFVRSLLHLIVLVFFICLLIRLVFDWIQVFARDWKPRGVVLIGAEAVYSVTDPPLRALRRVLPPIQLGSIRLDVAFLVLFLLCSVLLNVL